MNVSSVKNIILLAAISIVEALSALTIGALISTIWPFKLSAFANDLYPYFRLDIHPEREMLLYRITVFLAIGIMTTLICVFKKRLDDISLRHRLVEWLMVMGMFVLAQAFWSFKVVVNAPGNASLTALIITTVLVYLIKIFYPECRRYAINIYEYCCVLSSRSKIHPLDIFLPLLIVAVFWITDLNQALALIFVTDQFYHLDGFMMSAIWSLHQGLQLNTDVISQYSVLMPKVLHQFLILAGGISYGHLISVMVCLTIFYWLSTYYLLIRMTADRFIAAACVLLAIKWQTFHEGVVPIIWRYGSPTVLRFIFDIAVLGLVFQHARDNRRRWLVLASICCGLSLAWMLDTGIYLTAAFVVYLLGHCWVKRSNWLNGLMSVVIIGVTTLASFTYAVGHHVIEASFWQRMFEHAGLFLAGFGSLPITDGLNQNHFYCFIKGLLIPVIYLGVFLWQLARFIDDKNNKHALWVMMVCCYGLGLYHYFINRSAYTSFDVVCVPLVILIALRLLTLKTVFEKHWVWLKWLLLVFMLGALLTTRMMAFYPNVFYQQTKELKQVKAFYEQQSDLSADASMIASLTKPDERVAMISSFEISLLMQAKRTPYFYYTPMIESTLWTNDIFRGTYLHQRARFEKTATKWQQSPPRTVVIQTSLIKGPNASQYWQAHPTLKALIDLMGQRYQEVKQGQWVTVYQAQ